MTTLSGLSKRLGDSAACVLLAGVLLGFGSASAQPTRWEMRVCADPNNFPASSRERPGFENQLAALLADEMQARLTYVWAYRGDDMIKHQLRAGACDLAVGVADGTLGVLSTIVYQQSPYVFIYRRTSGLTLQSLSDAELTTLRIGTYPFSVPYMALLEFGLKDNIVLRHAVGGPGGPNFDAPLLQSLVDGEVDVALAYGPVAGHFAKAHPGTWEVVPVSPVFVPPSLQMVRQWTIAVRPGDEALRDRLNVALVARWNDFEQVFRAFGVPFNPLPRPTASF